VRTKDEVDVVVKSIRLGVATVTPVPPEEAIRHRAILEEATCDREVELLVLHAAIDKEGGGEDGLGVNGSVAGEDKGEIRVARDRLLNAMVAVFSCGAEIPDAAAVLNAIGLELLKRR
jgi:hypothetical protein